MIVVIAILAAITIVAYNGVQVRARDSQRSQDMASIKSLILNYGTLNGGVPSTATFGGSGPGGWNISSMPSWLNFLQASSPGKIPVDPINTGVADPGPGTYELTYFYFCYPTGTGPLPATPNVSLGYFSEMTHSKVSLPFAVDQCL